MRMILCLALGVIFGCSMREALARDVGQWEAGDPAIRLVQALDAAGYAIIVMLW
jgi:hypothetical protein